jgi:isoleucyl-tRNA synthetase
MPFAQVHYPFENREWFDSHYPGDFIVEYIGQTRGWFYTLHVLATALFDRPSFNTCVSHGVVLGDDGMKMSKSLKNYPDPMMVFDNHGADAMRWYLLSSAILRGNDLAVTEEGIRDTVRQVLLPLWNTWYFLSLYARAEGRSGSWRTDSTDELDRYILAKTHDLVTVVTAQMDAYDLFAACGSVRTYLDVLTNWYVRRSRDRFWDGDQAAIDTLHTVLSVLCRVAAPLLPLTSEAVYRGLTGERSVHLTDWPSADELPADPELVRSMDLARDVCSVTLRLRKAQQLRVRLPLRSLTIATHGADQLASLSSLIADEVNVKEVVLSDDVAAVASTELQVVPAALGPRLGRRTQEVIAAVKAGAWRRDGDVVVAGDVELFEGEYSLKLVVAGDGASAPLPDGSGIVVLDVEVTPELLAEGTARDVIRLVQQTRRETGLDVSDRIELTLGVPQSVRRALQPFEQMVMEETLAVRVSYDGGEPTTELDGEPIHVSVAPLR